MLALENSQRAIKIIRDLPQRPSVNMQTPARLQEKFPFVFVIAHTDMCVSLAYIQAKRRHLASLIWTVRVFMCDLVEVLNTG